MRILVYISLSLLLSSCLTFKSVSRYSHSDRPGPTGMVSSEPEVGYLKEPTDQKSMRFKIGTAPEDLLMAEIKKWVGTPYLYGGTTAEGIDCSGFTQNIFKAVYAYYLPRTSKEQFLLGRTIEQSNLKQGDLLFFKLSENRGISHVGIYVGNNQFAHASVSQGVTISDLADPYWSASYRGGRRISP